MASNKCIKIFEQSNSTREFTLPVLIATLGWLLNLLGGETIKSFSATTNINFTMNTQLQTFLNLDTPQLIKDILIGNLLGDGGLSKVQR